MPSDVSTAPSILLQSDVTLNANSKVLTVPNGRVWEILNIYANWQASGSANAGTRQLRVSWRDAADTVIGQVVAGATQTNVDRTYDIGPGNADLTAFRDTDILLTPTPVIFLPEGFDLRVFDDNNVDAAVDDLLVYVLIREYIIP